MGFQGQLASVNLTDIFQTLSMNRQTGTLAVTGAGPALHVYFENGQVSRCTAPAVDGLPFLLHALSRRGLLAPEQVEDIANRLRDTQHPLRELIDASGYIAQQDLDEALAWCIEEMVCPLFERKDGEFSFYDGQPTPELLAPDVLAMGDIKIQTTQLVLEATRREDEWKRIREVIPDNGAMFVIDNDGRANLKNVESDAEMLKVLRYLDGRHTIDEISQSVGVARFDTFAIVAQLALAGVARIRAPQEMIADAVELRQQGDLARARDLLESIATQSNVPEVLRPLAEICVELKESSRAVELYLELIQAAQDAGALDQALADLDMVIKLSPGDPDLHFDRAQVLADLGREQDAAGAFVSAAQAYLQTKDVAQAIDACHRAKNLWPRAPEPHRHLARAYLMEGQTDNALIEYKSLWHALLSTMSPRKALDELRRTLDAECRFAAVKEQVLAHAQSSEAVKTASAARLLIYAMLVIVLAAGGAFGLQYLKNHLFRENKEKELVAFRQALPNRLAALEHQQVFDELARVGSSLAGYADLVEQVDTIRGDVRADADKRVADLVATVKSYLDAGDLDHAEQTWKDLQKRFGYLPEYDSQARKGLAEIQAQRLAREIRPQVEEAGRLWADLQWEKARDALKQVIDRKDLTDAVRDPLKGELAKWVEQLDSAESMYRRHEALVQRNDRLAAIAVLRDALKAKGEPWRDRARAALKQLEGEQAEQLGDRIKALLEGGNEQEAFALLDALRDLAAKAANNNVQDYLAKYQLPFSVKLESPLVELVVKGERIPPPAGTEGAWTHTVLYPVAGKVAIEARRKGFRPQPITVSAEARKAGIAIALRRGPSWRAELGADVAATPAASDKVVLAATRKPTLEIIDPGLGTSRSIAFPDTLEHFAATPTLFGGRAYAVLDDRVIAVELNTRALAWQYPEQGQANLVELNAASLVVQEHEFIPGQLQVFVGSGRGKVMTLGWADGKTIVYHETDVDAAISGGMLVDHAGTTSTLYVPTANGLFAFDPTSVSEATPMVRRWQLPGGEIVGRPVRAVVAGRPAILFADATGTVVAIDADPTVADGKRTVGSWPMQNGVTSGVVVQGAVAFLACGSANDGHVVAIDLAHPGQLRWRYPAKGAIGALAGAPAIGRNGIYAGDANGRVFCIDPATGAERWQADLQSPIVGGILAHEGLIYVPAKGGSLSCFEEGEP